MSDEPRGAGEIARVERAVEFHADQHGAVGGRFNSRDVDLARGRVRPLRKTETGLEPRGEGPLARRLRAALDRGERRVERASVADQSVRQTHGGLRGIIRHAERFFSGLGTVARRDFDQIGRDFRIERVLSKVRAEDFGALWIRGGVSAHEARFERGRKGLGQIFRHRGEGPRERRPGVGVFREVPDEQQLAVLDPAVLIQDELDEQLSGLGRLAGQSRCVDEAHQRGAGIDRRVFDRLRVTLDRLVRTTELHVDVAGLLEQFAPAAVNLSQFGAVIRVLGERVGKGDRVAERFGGGGGIPQFRQGFTEVGVHDERESRVGIEIRRLPRPGEICRGAVEIGLLR